MKLMHVLPIANSGLESREILYSVESSHPSEVPVVFACLLWLLCMNISKS